VLCAVFFLQVSLLAMVEKSYKIGEVAEMLGVHEDTLRNWDAHGLVVADRVGTRKDRRYTVEHIKQIKEKGLVSDLARRQPSGRDYSDYSKEQLIKELQILKEQRKYGLVWEDKPEEVVEMCKTQAPILKSVPKMNVAGRKGEQRNIMIEGDNYHALQVLNYTHKGKIDVIYIDPPYNTGAKDWKYNNDYVEKEDAFRHSKWISMLYKRMLLAKSLLKSDGVMIVTIDDHELFSLLGIIEDLDATTLGRVTVSIKPEGRQQSRYVMESHEYIIFMSWGVPKIRGLNINFGSDFTEEDEISKFKWEGFMRRDAGREDRSSNTWYPIYVDQQGNVSLKEKPNTIKVLPINTKGIERVWLWSEERAQKDISELKAVIRNNRATVYYKRREQERVKPTSIWFGSKYNANAYGTRLLSRILPENNFDYPKSLYSVLDAIDLFLPKDGLVLDFFAGSGTAGHAVMELNKEDSGSRRFILCTNNENNNGNGHGGIAESVCQPRIKKVMKGYKKNGNGERVEGLGGSLEYFKTEFIDVENVSDVPDKKRLRFTHEAGHVVALKENAFTELEKNNWYQIFTDGLDKYVGLYFRENIEKLEDLEQKILNRGEVKLYIFSHGGSDDWKNDYTEHENVIVEDIPEPILKVYKILNS